MKFSNTYTTSTNDGTLFNNDKVILLKGIPEPQSESVMLTDLLGILLCRRGRAQFQINGVTWSMSKDDLLVVHPHVMLHGSLYSNDFQCICICLYVDHIQNLIPLSRRWNVRDYYESTPLRNLSRDDVNVFLQYFNILHSRSVSNKSKIAEDIIDALSIAFLYELGTFGYNSPQKHRPNINSAENLFQKFGALLYSSFPKKRSVKHYATQLCITPKYLSTICKKIAGKTATELINAAVVEDIKQKLAHSPKSIKEIAYELDFQDGSSFGKFVKAKLGLSPIEYRNRASSQR